MNTLEELAAKVESLRAEIAELKSRQPTVVVNRGDSLIVQHANPTQQARIIVECKDKDRKMYLKFQDGNCGVLELIAQAREEGRQEERARCVKAIADVAAMLLALKDGGLAKLAATNTKIGDAG